MVRYTQNPRSSLNSSANNETDENIEIDPNSTVERNEPSSPTPTLPTEENPRRVYLRDRPRPTYASIALRNAPRSGDGNEENIDPIPLLLSGDLRAPQDGRPRQSVPFPRQISMTGNPGNIRGVRPISATVTSASQLRPPSPRPISSPIDRPFYRPFSPIRTVSPRPEMLQDLNGIERCFMGQDDLANERITPRRILRRPQSLLSLDLNTENPANGIAETSGRTENAENTENTENAENVENTETTVRERRDAEGAESNESTSEVQNATGNGINGGIDLPTINGTARPNVENPIRGLNLPRLRARRREIERGLAEASQIIQELEAMERNEREIHRNGHAPDPHQRPHRFINVIDPFTGPPPRYGAGGHGRGRGAGRRAPGGLNPLREQDPIRELTHQIMAQTTEMRNLRDVMGGLSNTIHSNTEFLEQIVASNGEILNEIRDD